MYSGAANGNRTKTQIGTDDVSLHSQGSIVPADYVSAGHVLVSADFIPVSADASTLPPGQSLGSSANTTRFPLPSDVSKDQLSSGIFTSSSYDDEFSATLTNLAPLVDVNPVPTRRVNTIHPQSQILGDLASPVLTRSRAQKSKFGESAFIGYIQDQQRTNQTDSFHYLFVCFLSQLEPTSIATTLEDPVGLLPSREMHQFNQPASMETMTSSSTLSLNATTPMEAPKTKLKDESDPPVNVHLYRSMIGSLMYLTASRPDIMFAVSSCSRHQFTPLTSHLNAVKKIFKDRIMLGSHVDRKSNYRWMYNCLGRRLISWQVKKQAIVATLNKALYIIPAGLLGFLAGSTVILLGVILPAGCLVSAGSPMILLGVILPAGCLVSAGSHAGRHTSPGGFISADRVCIPAVCTVSAVDLNLSAGLTTNSCCWSSFMRSIHPFMLQN
ncbi:hypothetical protein Tco_0932184 [Tanacetum coccineum]